MRALVYGRRDDVQKLVCENEHCRGPLLSRWKIIYLTKERQGVKIDF
jgi:hypothetical protein